MDRDTRRRGYRALLDRAQGDALAIASLARLMQDDGLKEDAAALALRALKLAPGDGRVCALAREALSADVPKWHFWMVRDELRNAAYDAALRRAVTPRTRVLEIGTGSGLLAMMAARAGAKHVYTCEVIPQIAQAAREVIAHNGLADRITVLGKHSEAVTPQEIGGPVDVLVSEIVSNNLLNEKVLPALSDAMDRLVVRGGTIIPSAGCIRVALARHARADERRLGTVAGFDLSPFNVLSRPVYRLAVDDKDLCLCSDPVDLFRFDFSNGGPWPSAAVSMDLQGSGTGANGIAQWIALEMDEVGRYENRPATLPMSAWAILFHPFDDEPERPTDGLWRVHGRAEAALLRLWTEFVSDTRR